MLQINLKLAIRNIFRNKLYSVINITGLSVASAFCILVYLYVKNEQSFDAFHKDTDQLYRVEQTDIFGSSARFQPKKNFFSFLMKDAEQVNMIQTPTALAVELKKNFPEIEYAVRFEGLGPETIRVGNKSFKEKSDNLTYADADFFKVFNYPLATGNKNAVLQGRNVAAISESLAVKYFGSTSVIGKTFSMPNDTTQPPLTISGVFKNFPSNSSFQFDMILPLMSNPDYKNRIANGLNTFSDPLVIKLKKGTNLNKFQHKLSTFANSYYNDTRAGVNNNHQDRKISMDIILRPFAQAHYNQSPGWGHYTDFKNIYQLVCLTGILIFIASLNYILLTITSTLSHSQDVGVRKTMGASRFTIILQYYTGTQLLTGLSVIVGFLIASTCLPFFESLTGTKLDLSNFSYGTLFLFLLALTIVLGLMAGIYPAFTMSGLKPLTIMRSFSAYKLNPFLSRFLIMMQFTICIILVISTLAIDRQIRYIDHANMGYNKDQVLIIKSPYGWNDKLKTLALKERLFNYAASNPAIQDIIAASGPYLGGDNNNFLINGNSTMLQAPDIDYNYFSFMQIPIIKGRTFSKEFPSDTAKMADVGLKAGQSNSLAVRKIVLNETLYNLLGQPKLDVINRDMKSIIIGVVKDYHITDLTKKIPPVYHTLHRHTPACFWIKIKAGKSIPEVINNIKAKWNVMTNSEPFDYTFLDQEVAKNYESYLRWMKTITIASVLSILVACLGLFGLSGLTTLNRTKEIGIRKVLGASVSNLFVLLNRSTIFMALCSFIIAAPVALYLVHGWLDNFAYRIKPDWPLFAAAGIIALTTAVIAVSYHTIRAATGNPVDSLRSE